MLSILGWLFFPYIMLILRWRRLNKLARVAGTVWAIIALLIVIGSLANPDQPAPNAALDGKYDVKLAFPADRYPETADHIHDAIANGESAICTIDRDEAKSHREASLAGIPTKKGYDRDEWPMAMCAEGGAGADIRYVTPSDNRGAGSWIGNQLDELADGTRVLIVLEGGKGKDIHSTVNDSLTVKKDAGKVGVNEPAQASLVDKGKSATTTAPSQDTGTAKHDPADKPATTQPAGSTNAQATDKSASKPQTETQSKPLATKPSVEQQPAKPAVSEQPSVSYRNCTAVRAAGAAPLYEGDPGYSRKLDRDGDGVACE